MLHDTRPEPGKNKALALTLLMHALLVAVLFLGVQWKRSAPDVVEVELWSPRTSQPPPPAPAPDPVKPEVKPEPAKPEPPKPEPKPPVKPDIVEKIEKKPPKPEPKKPEPPKPEPPVKPAPPKPVPDWQKQLDQELTQVRTEANRQAVANAADSELRAAASKRGLATWGDKIRTKIRGNMTLPPAIQGNPEAVFEINLLPTGEVMQPVKLKRSSGNPVLDAAIERAILKSSPLPKPDDPNVFQRVIEIKYRPFEE